MGLLTVSILSHQKYWTTNDCWKNMAAAYDLLQGWYCEWGHKPSHLMCKGIDMICHNFMTLYQKEGPSEEPIPLHIQPASIEDTVPDTTNVLLAVKWMWCVKSPGPSGICVCDILFWECNHSKIWNEFIFTVQDFCFQGNPLPQEFSYSILFLIPKAELEVC
jgi:hypothetical protein